LGLFHLPSLSLNSLRAYLVCHIAAKTESRLSNQEQAAGLVQKTANAAGCWDNYIVSAGSLKVIITDQFSFCQSFLGAGFWSGFGQTQVQSCGRGSVIVSLRYSILA
jgi:hypothetical protein